MSTADQDHENESAGEILRDEEGDVLEQSPLGDALDLEAWDVAAPPAGFAERVLDRVRSENAGNAENAEEPARITTAARTRRRWLAVSGGVATLAVAAMMLLRVSSPPSQGEAIAKDRVEVALGSRALAVLEPGATVKWNGDDVEQSRGDVFYRVEPGKRFTVHTPAGEVEVKGTCFTVKVRALPDAAKSLAFVVVHEGKVGVTPGVSAKDHAHVDLKAGESAQSGPEGVTRTSGMSSDGEKAFDQRAAALDVKAEDDSTSRANQNLVRQVSDYRSRLEAIAAQKRELEEKLKNSEERLAASRDGSVVIPHGFDLSSEDWKELAKTGTIKYRIPCSSRNGGYQPKPEALTNLGLQPADGEVIRDAYARSTKRYWDAIKPLCSAAIGNPDIAEKIGPDTCIHLILDLESERDNEAVRVARRQVGEIRAGIKPMPGPNDKLHPVTRIFLTATGEAKALEDDLAKSYGPEEAHRLVYSDELCFGHSTFGSGAKD